MRISSSMVYDIGLRSINDKSTTYLHNMQMLATGRRIVTPADDPVAAARALVVTEAKDINTQFSTTQDNAKGALALEETQMSSLNDLLTRIRTLAVQGGNPALSPSDLRSITTELRGRFDELLGIANTTDSNGDFIFSGNMGTTKPFSANVDALLAAAGNEVTYSGDSGQRGLQVSPTRFLQISDSGADVFRQIDNGNGYFVTDYAKTNTGTAVIDAGSVTNQATWDGQPNKNYSINFWVDANGIAGQPGKTYYDLVDTKTGNSMLTGATPQVPTAGPPAVSLATAGLRVYRDNAGIPLSSQPGDPGPRFDLGGIVNVTGVPASGDTFSISPSSSQSVFKTLANLIGTLEAMQSASVTGAAFAGPLTITAANNTLSLTVNGVQKNIVIPGGTYNNSSTLANAINAAIVDPVNGFGAAVATASGANGTIVLSAPTTGSSNSGISVVSGSLPVSSIFGTTLPGTPFAPNAKANAGGQLNLTINAVPTAVNVPAGIYSDSNALANAISAANPGVFGAGGPATVSGANGSVVITAPSAVMTLGASVPAGLNTAIFGASTTTGPMQSNLLRSPTALANDIGQTLTNLDQATDNILRVRAGIGARLNELESLSSVNQDVNLRYNETLSSLQDVDYAKSVSDLQQSQTSLDAAQKSYMKVTQMGLFNYL